MGCEKWGIGEFGVEKGEKMLDQDIRFLAEELEKGKLVVFVGAGVSKNSGLPDWKELIKDYAEYRGIKEFTLKEYLTIPEEVFERYGSLKYYEIAEKRLSGKYVPNSVHRILKKMDLIYIITTNYDTLIEDEIKNLQVVSKDEDLPYTSSNRMLIKMHGNFENKNIVLKKSDYDNYEKKFPLISTLIKGLFTTNTILFIGYSYNDINVQQIMNWIKEILKEKIRKAFLVEFTNENNKEEENSEQINKISLKLSNDNNDEVLYENKKERFNNNYEKTLTKFLSDIYNEKENVKQEKTFEIYKNLNYLMGIHLEKILKNSQLIYGDFTKKKIMIIRNEEIKDIVKYEEILFKSGVNRVILNSNTDKEKEFVPYLRKERDEAEKVKKIKKELEKNRIIEEKFLETIYNYDYQNFKSLINEYIEKKYVNKYVIVYGYLFFREIDEAKKLIESMIEEKENLNDKKEKIIWDNFILSIIECMEIMDAGYNLNTDESFESIRENLKNKYFEYFKEKTQLYNEIFNFSTFEDINNQMSQLLEKIRKNEMYLKLVKSYIDEAKYLEKEFFRFCSLNGLFVFDAEFIEKYIEILFILYRNKKFFENFRFFDLFLMLELESNRFFDLFDKYAIKKLDDEGNVIEKLIVLLEDTLKYNKVKYDKYDKLEKLLFLITKFDLKDIQLKKLIDIILSFKNGNIFFEKGNIFRISDFFRGIIVQNHKKLDKEFFDKILEKIFTIDRIDEKLMEVIAYCFKENKISKNDELKKFIDKNNLKIKSYFLKIIDEPYFEELKNEILQELKNTSNIEVYNFLLNQRFIDFIPEMEEKILEELDKIYQKKDNIYDLVNFISSILDFLLESSLNDRLPISFIEKLRDYKNEEFFKLLKQYQSEVLWNSILYEKNFDYSKFTKNELDRFTKIGIKNLLKKNDKKLIKVIREYVFSKIKTNDNVSTDKVVEAYFEWESEKNEATE